MTRRTYDAASMQVYELVREEVGYLPCINETETWRALIPFGYACMYICMSKNSDRSMEVKFTAIWKIMTDRRTDQPTDRWQMDISFTFNNRKYRYYVRVKTSIKLRERIINKGSGLMTNKLSL